MMQIETAPLLLVGIATSQLGVREKGPNRGAQVEQYQRAVDGKASGEPWCAAFVWWCIDEADKTLDTKSHLHRTEHCLTMWNESPHDARTGKPEPGCLVVWQHYKQGQATAQGHVGIVLAQQGGNIWTIEGNTGSGIGVQREGDGVYLRSRLALANGYGPMRIKGFLKPWPIA